VRSSLGRLARVKGMSLVPSIAKVLCPHVPSAENDLFTSSGNSANCLGELRNHEMYSLVIKLSIASQYLLIVLETGSLNSPMALSGIFFSLPKSITSFTFAAHLQHLAS
jgi:hypothetical protein